MSPCSDLNLLIRFLSDVTRKLTDNSYMYKKRTFVISENFQTFKFFKFLEFSKNFGKFNDFQMLKVTFSSFNRFVSFMCVFGVGIKMVTLNESINYKIEQKDSTNFFV